MCELSEVGTVTRTELPGKGKKGGGGWRGAGGGRG